MAKQTSFALNEKSEETLVEYGKYLEEVSKYLGLPTTTFTKNQLINGALAMLSVCNTRYNVFKVGKGMELFT